MSQALQLHSDTMAEWQIMRDQASMLVKSGFLPKSVTTPEQALAIILMGRELGIGAMVALNNINVIQGKPTIPPQLMLALINRSGQLEDIKTETGKDGATCTIKRRGQQPHTARFGPAEARSMGLDGKDNYKKQPAIMYQWRAIAAAARVTFPDVIHGMYLPEEMGADVDVETGEVVEALPEPTELESVPRVKLEGAQPHSASEELLELNRRLGYSEAQLLKWLIGKFNIDANLNLPGALGSLGDGELSQAIDIFRQRLKP